MAICVVSCSVVFFSRHTNSLDAQVIISQPCWPGQLSSPLLVLCVFVGFGCLCVLVFYFGFLFGVFCFSFGT
jgi:hypothetical protein